MKPPPVYIAAPYGAPDPMGIAWNVTRAGLLARLAALDGLAPILVHPAIPMIYGDESPETRAAGLARNVALVELVARTTLGRLWILEADPPAINSSVPLPGLLTPGVRAELVAWAQARGSSSDGVNRGTWKAWESRARRHGLGAPWASLAERPEATPTGLDGELQAFAGLVDRVRRDPELAARLVAQLQERS